MKMQILSPKGMTHQTARRLSPRLPALDGLRVGLLSNQKANAELLLSEVAGLFATQHGCSIASIEKKPDVSRPAAPEMLSAVANKADFLITAIGD